VQGAEGTLGRRTPPEIREVSLPEKVSCVLEWHRREWERYVSLPQSGQETNSVYIAVIHIGRMRLIIKSQILVRCSEVRPGFCTATHPAAHKWLGSSRTC